MPNRALTEGEALRRMYRITSDPERPFEAKAEALISLGRAYLDVESGFLTRIEDGTQDIVHAGGDHELLRSGQSCPLSKAYCRRTIETDGALTVQHAAVEGWEDDAAYDEFGLESYVGAKVLLDGEVYGTFCFADAEPREAPFTDEEEVFVELLAQWVSYEVFERRARERIQRQRDELESFARVVSHDLRNPLGSLDGYLDLAEETGDPEHFERCRRAVDRMEALIDDLLFLAREGESVGEPASVALDEVAEAAWSFVEAPDATLDADEVAGTELLADRSRLQQLFENLFRNAVEHGSTSSRTGSDDAVEHGRPSVVVRVRLLEDGSGFRIEDDGRGFPEGTAPESIFEEGYTTDGNGTGLGLAIVRRIADGHDWRIAAGASDEGGARFDVTGVSFGSDADGSECGNDPIT